MAPRHSSSRKVGLKRIDAAIDALLPLGFKKGVIRKNVNKLLKVYEGDDGWVFIEEACYKLLIETILEEQENEQAKTLELCEGQGKAPLVSPSSSDEGAGEGPSNIELAIMENTETEDQSEARDQAGEGGQMLPLLEGNRIGSGGTLQQSRDIASSNPVPRRRPPCYGWISESDEEKDEGEANCIYYRDPDRQRKRRWDVRPSDL
ncbi:hypothetical protein H6P81_006861 [Aristolochia fimbriata]|uniref:WIYLD domain-containing protein n=1 Tax=Aristolochia fimbriata TaxID=158543 RepID=A0AAV7F1Y1_ARIFI|nr:hypothetical protein H6P81_006861 [Aristolochia fimbriata]